jgi:hypothetical protein
VPTAHRRSPNQRIDRYGPPRTDKVAGQPVRRGSVAPNLALRSAVGAALGREHISARSIPAH